MITRPRPCFRFAVLVATTAALFTAINVLCGTGNRGQCLFWSSF